MFQRGDAVGADHLTAHVVAVGGAEHDLDVDDRASGHLDDGDLWIVVLAEGSGAAARREYAHSSRLVVEQPTDDVELVHRRVGHRHLAREARRHPRVAVHAVDDQGHADRAGVDRRLHLPVAGVEASHEPDLHEPTTADRLRRDDRSRVVERGSERLLAQHRFAGSEARVHLGGVGEADASDDHGVDVGAGDERFRAVVGGRRQFGGERCRAGCVDVEHTRHRRTADPTGQRAGVLRADRAGPDDSDP